MTYEEREFIKCSVLHANTLKAFGVSSVEASYECVLVARLRRIYGADTIASSIFSCGDTQAPILDTVYIERSL